MANVVNYLRINFDENREIDAGLQNRKYSNNIWPYNNKSLLVS